MPTEFEEHDGKPVAVKLKFGPGMESRSEITAWEISQRHIDVADSPNCRVVRVDVAWKAEATCAVK